MPQLHARKWRFYFAVIVMLAPAAGRGQISPGPLSKSHRQLEGIRFCTSCHEFGKQLSDAKCLACHATIKSRIEQRRGFHGQVVGQQKQNCVACHKEHGGENFSLIFWENGEAGFDHAQTGFTLTGKHRPLPCRDCHQPRFITENFGADKNVQLAKTFLGLSKDCGGCHADEHRGQLGKDCQRCHGSDGWKPAPQFLHDRTKFPLTGRHQQVDCAKCHREQAAPQKVGNEKTAAFVQFTGLSFGNCVPCHQDPHRGGFGQDCVRCHSTDGWKRVARDRFNHDLTDFPLRGRHVNVTCEQCHRGSDFKKAIKHQLCSDCHGDAHGGQFARRLDRGACESCHTVQGFSPSTFTIANHVRTRFALTGGHLATPCEFCHVRVKRGMISPFIPDTPAGRRGMQRFTFDDRRCQSCHADEHRGQFAAQIARQGCEGCHGSESWHQTKFNHDLSRFPLKGRHQLLACSACHKPEKENGDAFVRYRPLAAACNDCHKDAHRGQFKENGTTRCERCHEPAGWTKLLFVHNRDSSFKLDGAHIKVACEKCHFQLEMKGNGSIVVYKPLRKECAACHR